MSGAATLTPAGDPSAPDAGRDGLDIETRLRTICGHLNALHAQLVDITAEAMTTGCWDVTGVHSLTHWLTWKAGLTTSHADEIVRLAAARDSHPAVSAVFNNGALSLDQAALAVKAPAYLDSDFAELAVAATLPQLRLMVRAANPGPGLTTPTPPAASDNSPESPTSAPTDPAAQPVAGPPETFTTGTDEYGRFWLHGELDADHGRILDAALTEARDALFHDGQTNVTWADALIEIAHRSLDHTTTERRERFRANWFINPADPIPARWSDGHPVPSWLQHMLTCDGTISPVFTNGAHPINVGRTQRTIPDRTRRVVEHRDRKCRVPWCTQTRWLQVHHVIHHEHGGPTDTSNLIALCPADHRRHHRGLLGITGNADQPNGLTFTNRDGQPMDPAAQPITPTTPPPDPHVEYRHPLGQHLQRDAILFPDPPNDRPGATAA